MNNNSLNIIRTIKNAKTAKEGIQILKENIQLKDVNKTYNEVFKLPFYKRTLLGNALPKKIEDFSFNSTRFEKSNFEKELVWGSNVFRLYANEINQFNKLRKAYLKELLLSNYESATEYLNQIEKEIGISLWLIENQISLIQLKDGLEKQKSFTTQIVENNDANSDYRILSSFFSIKAEKNVAPDKYDKEIKNFLRTTKDETLKNPKRIYDHLTFKLNKEFIDDYKYEYILQNDTELSLIDRYLTFVDILLNLKAKDELEFNSTTTKQIWDNIKNIEDNDLKNFWFFEIGNNADINFISNKIYVVEIFDLYILNDYKNVVNRCEEIFSEKPYTTDLYEVYAKALIKCNESPKFFDSLFAQIINSLIELYKGLKKSEEFYIDLLKISYIFSSDIWAKKLRGIAINAFYGNHEGAVNSYSIISSSLSSLNTPELSALIYSNKKLSITNQYLEIFKDSTTMKLQHSYVTGSVNEVLNMNLPEDKKNKYLSEIYFFEKNYNEANRFLNLVLEQNDEINKLEAVSKKIISSLKLGFKEESLDLFINQYFINSNILFKINLKELIRELDLNSFNKKNLNIPIILHIYCMHVSDEKEGTRNDSFEDFLDAWEVTKPSQLIIDNFDKNKINYFYKNICTTGIMATSILFDSQLSVEDERLSICQKMSSIDQENSIYYTKEIKDITKSRMVTKGIRDIEKSKIYVDIEGIKNSLEKTIKESFIRYKSFDFDVSNANPNYIVIDKESNLYVPVDEKWNLFSTMVIEIRNSFVSSKEYGLDGYLSVGIRHGTLSGQLRGKIESENLITQIGSNDRSYQDNFYWLNKLNISSEKDMTYIKDQLNQFSEEIDNLISKLKNELIQINIDNINNETALFNYIFTTEDLEYLNEKMNKEVEYNEFIDIVIDFLWMRTDVNLDNINAYLKNNFKSNVNLCFEKLQNNINMLKDSIDIADLTNSIVKIKTEIQYEIDNISNWFSRKNASEQKDYEISLPIDIGLEMANNIFKNLNGYEIINKDIDQIYLKGKTFGRLVDISFIIFDNIFKHSGITNEQKINLKCYMENENLVLKCINNVSKEFDLEKLNKEMSRKKEKLQQKDVLEMVSKEGGSGFYKIHKIISIDLKCDLIMDICYINDYTFSIELKISGKELLSENFNRRG